MRPLIIVPCTIADARRFVAMHHRHHPRLVGALFAVGVAMDGELVGVATVGRPVARGNQDDWTAEVTRCCVVLGVPNGASMLYGACWRAARALGWRRLITYTLASEPGTSLRASGFNLVGNVTARSWNCPSRPRAENPLQPKLRWEM